MLASLLASSCVGSVQVIMAGELISAKEDSRKMPGSGRQLEEKILHLHARFLRAPKEERAKVSGYWGS